MQQVSVCPGHTALIDDEDFALVNRYRWHFEHGYARACPTFKGPKIYMHRLILGNSAGPRTDHINFDKLDNRRSNLRPATASQNTCNQRGWKNKTSSCFKGVFRDHRNGAWVARIVIHRVRKHLGMFRTEEDAARAYNKAAIEFHGSFAHLNSVPS